MAYIVVKRAKILINSDGTRTSGEASVEFIENGDGKCGSDGGVIIRYRADECVNVLTVGGDRDGGGGRANIRRLNGGGRDGGGTDKNKNETGGSFSMPLRVGEPCGFNIETPYGGIDANVVAHKIETRFYGNGVKIILDYTLTYGGTHTERKRVDIDAVFLE